MKKTALSYVFLLLVLAGCQPGTEGTTPNVYPYDLHVEVADHTMTVSWKRHGNAAIAGYNIYLSEQPLVTKYPGNKLPPDIKPFNRVVFPGDTNPDDGIEHFIAKHLENGKRYYVSVRVVFPDRSLSKPTAEIAAACGPRGTITLGNRYVVQPDGYSFVKDTFVKVDGLENDIYFFSKDAQTNYLSSPHRLGGFLRHTRLAALPYRGTLEEVLAQLQTHPVTEFDDRVKVTKGMWLYGKTDEGYPLLLHVLDLTGSGTERRVTLFYALSMVKDTVFF
ncbi:MAG: hypothetical protein D6800_07170 [Candidatus Zixiibacteriota bacterium]|nr:MAG: hypothetical protein D6800_07170 [candidate division Zixibacteria bacterium]